MKGKSLYIAYGSNLSVEQMAFRCPDAKPVGTAVLKDWKLVFRVHATIEPRKGAAVPVLIWEISEDDEKRLDRYEGWPRYYYKEYLNLDMKPIDGGRKIKVAAMVYIMTEGRSEVRLPMKGYYDTLAEGYERFGFDKKILKDALREAKEAEHVFS